MLESLPFEKQAELIVYSFLISNLILFYIIYRYRENEYVQNGTCALFIVLLLTCAVLPEANWPENPYPTEISDKYIETHSFIGFERDCYVFEFKNGTGMLERGSVAKTDYYKYEIGDKYNYTWAEEW